MDSKSREKINYDHRIEDGKYGKPEYLTENETLESRVLTGLKIDLSEVRGVNKNSTDTHG